MKAMGELQIEIAEENAHDKAQISRSRLPRKRNSVKILTILQSSKGSTNQVAGRHSKVRTWTRIG